MLPNSVNRPLDPVEKLFWMLNRVSSMNYCMIAELEGTPDAERLGSALARVQKRHPHAMARIHRTPAGALILESDRTPIRLRQAAARPETWLEHVSGELSCRFADDEAPLFRAVLLDIGGGNSVFVLTFHHAIADGRSGVQFLFEILKGYDLPSAEGAGAPPPAMHEVFPDVYRGASADAAAALVLAARKAEFKRLGPAERLPRFRAKADGPFDPSMYRVTIDGPLLSALGARAHEAGTSISGAVSAAQLLAVNARFGSEASGPRTLCLTTPADMRPYLDPPVGAVPLALYLTLLSTSLKVDPGAGLWRLAREVTEDIHGQIRRGDAHLLSRMIGPLLGIPATDEGCAAFGEAMMKSQQSSVVSNLGRIVTVEMGDRVRVGNLSFALCPLPYQPVFTVVSTYEGRMTLTVNFDRSRLPSDEAQGIASGLEQLLRSA